MLRFDPPELKEHLTNAAKIVKKFKLTKFFDDSYIMVLIEGDESEEIDDTITYQTELEYCWLPNIHEEGLEWKLSCREFIDLMDELQHATFEPPYQECFTEKRYLIRVWPVDDNSYLLLEEAIPLIEENLLSTELAERIRTMRSHLAYTTQTSRYFPCEINDSGQTILCSVTVGITIFGVLVAATGRYDEYFPAVSGHDTFLELRFDPRPSKELVRNAVQAYLFELSTGINLNLEASPHSFPPDSLNDSENEETFTKSMNYRIRSLMLGKGMDELLNLYNQSVTSTEPEIQILYLTKVLEYVSQTLVNQQSIEVVRTKLLSSRALQPDAEYITELIALVDEQRSYKKDKEAIKLTITKCCNAVELKKYAPQFLNKLLALSLDSSERDRNSALSHLGECLFATRNSVAHAKANYSPTGYECPETELPKFVTCVRVAAQQVIRWYHSQPEDARLS